MTGQAVLGATPASVPMLAGPQAPLVRRYAERLAQDAVPRGLIGPREIPRLWDRHILNCLVVAPLVPTAARVADVGSGAGLPGLVLAAARPDVQVLLIEPLLRRVTFLSDVVAELALRNVEVHRGRAEQIRGARFDVVTARAVAPLDRLLVWCLPLLRAHGELLAMKGSAAAAELADAEPTLRSSGASSWVVDRVGGDYVDPPTTLIRVVAGRRGHRRPQSSDTGHPQHRR